jgi:hypothetical protein
MFASELSAIGNDARQGRMLHGASSMGPRLRRILAEALILLLAGCAGAGSNGAASRLAVMGPPPGRVIVVFLRPALLDKAGASAVIDISAEPPVLVGVLMAGQKLAYVGDPGAHRFMVMGETADFMDAELRADRIYYALVGPRSGPTRERFLLRPVPANETALPAELGDCRWAGDGAAPPAWLKDHLAGIEKRKSADLPAWLASSHPMLEAGDSP